MKDWLNLMLYNCIQPVFYIHPDCDWYSWCDKVRKKKKKAAISVMTHSTNMVTICVRTIHRIFFSSHLIWLMVTFEQKSNILKCVVESFICLVYNFVIHSTHFFFLSEWKKRDSRWPFASGGYFFQKQSTLIFMVNLVRVLFM